MELPDLTSLDWNLMGTLYSGERLYYNKIADQVLLDKGDTKELYYERIKGTISFFHTCYHQVKIFEINTDKT